MVPKCCLRPYVDTAVAFVPSLGRIGLSLLLGLLLSGSVSCARRTESTPPATTQTEAHRLAGTAALDPHGESRAHMIESQIKSRGVRDEDVLRAMESVPRHEFVSREHIGQAYDDHPLPIGYGQTISQPYIVAAMTELLRLSRAARVLEVGAGSGYQAAILAELVDEVYTIEIIPELCEQARDRLLRLGYRNVQVRCGDGYYGWEEKGPFDAIIVTCAPDHIPQSLVSQLADEGRMVIPVGPPGAYQALWLVERHGQETRSERIMGVAFVPLTGAHEQ